MPRFGRFVGLMAAFSPVVKTENPSVVTDESGMPTKSTSLPYAILSFADGTRKLMLPGPYGGVNGPVRTCAVAAPMMLRFTRPQLPFAGTTAACAAAGRPRAATTARAGRRRRDIAPESRSGHPCGAPLAEPSRAI